jgi:CubicO group peptidase (beta-lactamase class C family)
MLACLLLAPFALLAQNLTGLPEATPEEVGLSSARLQELSSLLQQQVNDQVVAGVVTGVMKNGKLAYLESEGWLDLEQQTPLTTDAIFQIRSMSKPITAVAAMQLVEQGLMSLDDPVSKYIPRFGYMFVLINPDEPFLSAERKPTREITIEDLLLNTAGLSHRSSALYQQRRVRSRNETLQQLVAKVAGAPLTSDPGEEFQYSISLTVIGRVIEIVSGLPLDDYLQQNIFEPLQMTDTGFYVPQDHADRLALAYGSSEGTLSLLEPEAVPFTDDPPLKEGAAGLVSTAGDYLRFMQALLNAGEFDGARILRPQTVAMMTQNQLAAEMLPISLGPNRILNGFGWGYGMGVIVDGSQSRFEANTGEFGWSGSLGTFAWADPVTETVIVFMAQISPSSASGMGDKVKNLVHQSIED